MVSIIYFKVRNLNFPLRLLYKHLKKIMENTIIIGIASYFFLLIGIFALKSLLVANSETEQV